MTLYCLFLQRDGLEKQLTLRLQETSEKLEGQMTAKKEQWEEIKSQLEAELSSLLTELELTKQSKSDEVKQIER